MPRSINPGLLAHQRGGLAPQRRQGGSVTPISYTLPDGHSTSAS